MDIEVTPVLGLEPILTGEGLLRFQHQFGEASLLIDFDLPHAEVRRRLVERIEADECLVSAGGVLVTQLAPVELAQVAVHTILITAVSALREVLTRYLRAAEVGK